MGDPTSSVDRLSARHPPKVLNSSEDAHLKSMSVFEIDEHLQVLTSRALTVPSAPPSCAMMTIEASSHRLNYFLFSRVAQPHPSRRRPACKTSISEKLSICRSTGGKWVPARLSTLVLSIYKPMIVRRGGADRITRPSARAFITPQTGREHGKGGTA